MTTRTRFYIGETTLEDAPRIAGLLKQCGIDGATILPGQGVWKGELEPCLVVEILGPRIEGWNRHVAETLRAAYHQSAVLVTIDETAAYLQNWDGDAKPL